MLNEINLSRIDLNLFVVFEAVFTERHIGRAASRLNLTSSAVSHGLSRLRRLLNDPLFLRTPKGVVPTVRAEALAVEIQEVLARARTIVSASAPFDPHTSRRCFVIGAPDAISSVVLPDLLAAIAQEAPLVDLRIKQLLPPPNATSVASAWLPALEVLETRGLDMAILPMSSPPARFAARTLYPEDFVIACRRGHAFTTVGSLDSFCAQQHLVVSQSGDPFGFVDRSLGELGRTRRVVLTVPNFNMVPPILARSDLIAALPRRLVAAHAERYGLATVEAPMPLISEPISAIVTTASLKDDGVAWLLALVQRSCAK